MGGEPTGSGNSQTQRNYTASDFQIGETWGATPITRSFIQDENDFVISRLASNIAQITTPESKGTAFYLGKHNGEHIMATNAHVLKNVPSCMVLPVVFRFSLLKLTYTCSKIISIWRDVDFALLAINVDVASESFLNELNPLELAFKNDIIKDTLVYTSGYGEFNNPSNQLTLKNDDDCRIYSATNTFKRLRDPEKLGAKSIPSFAVGCDISPGDSGSPIVDRQTGEVLGLIWSTQTPKPITMRSSTFLQGLRSQENPEIWEHMAYGIPVMEIHKELLKYVRETRLSWPMRKRRKVVLSLLGLEE